MTLTSTPRLEGVVAAACLAGALLARALTGGMQEAAFARCDGGRPSAPEARRFLTLKPRRGLLLVAGI